VTFVERDPRAVKLIETNLERCGLASTRRRRGDRWDKPLSAAWMDPGAIAPPAPVPASAPNRYAIIRAGFADARKRLAGASFDIVFLDPPYGADELQGALAAAAPFVAADSLLIIEHAKRDRAPEAVEGLVRTRELVSGDSALSFYARAPTSSRAG
jgi:16S rRNA G966 N2-methylase RsmD